MADAPLSFRRAPVPAAIDTRYLDQLPSAVMLCDPASLEIRYANARSMRLLEALAHLLPVPPAEMIGGSLECLHPAFAELSALAENAQEPSRRLILSTRGERMEFHAHALRDPNGRPGFLQITWSVTTAVVAQEDAATRLRLVVDQLPLNVMTCSLPDLRIDYANAAARAAFDGLKAAYPAAAPGLVGTPMEMFFPSERLADAGSLPLTREVQAGGESIVFTVSALVGPGEQYLGPLVTWQVRSAGFVGAGMPTVPSLTPDEVLESLKASISRIRTVTASMEKIAGRARDAASQPPPAVQPLLQAALLPAVTVPAEASPPNVPETVAEQPSLPSTVVEIPQERSNYADLLRIRVERLLGRGG
ncbi:MAG: hypothetical protein B7X99_10285 [Rhizobiales bacterium 17-65-6]|nr:MAG: hypothetical protein B7X99_10285 [Rhizobiales bacterium 17-65-6]